MKSLSNLYLVLLLGILIFTSCDKEPDVIKECVFTSSVNYTLIPIDGGDTIEYKFIDPDGDGGVDPTITGGHLNSNTIYNGAVSIILGDYEEDVTGDIEEEGTDHQLFYVISEADLIIDYNDVDRDGNPIGLATTITTGDAGSGTLKVILKYEPDKTAAGVSSGDITNSGGETDIEVEFPITIQ